MAAETNVYFIRTELASSICVEQNLLLCVKTEFIQLRNPNLDRCSESIPSWGVHESQVQKRATQNRFRTEQSSSDFLPAASSKMKSSAESKNDADVELEAEGATASRHCRRPQLLDSNFQRLPVAVGTAPSIQAAARTFLLDAG